MATLDQLTVQLNANTEPLRRELARAAAAVEQTGRRIDTSLGAMDRAFAGLGRAARLFGAGLGAAALVSFGRNVIGAAANLGELAEQLGVSAQALQVYRFAAAQAGVSQAELEQALAKLTASLGEAAFDSAGQAAQAFRRLGVDLDAVNGAANPTEAALRAVAEAARRSGADSRFAADAKDVLGRSAQRLVPMLKDGAAGLDEFARQAPKISKANIDAADALSDAWERGLARVSAAAAEAALSLLRFFRPGPETASDEIARVTGEIEESVTRLVNLRARATRTAPLSDIIRDEEARLAALNARLALLSAPEIEPEPLKLDIRPTKQFLDSLEESRRQAIADAEKLEKAEAEGIERARRLLGARDELAAAGAREIADNELRLAALKVSGEEYEKVNVLIERNNALRAAGIPLTEEEIAANRAVAETIGRQRAEMNQLQQAAADAKAAARDFSHAIGNAFEDAVVKGGDLRAVLRGVLEDIQRIILRMTVTKPLENLLTGALGNAFGGLFGGGNAVQLAGGGLSAFGGPRQHGGPVDRNRPYLIGEEGPELFTPHVPGMIVPNDQLRRMYEGGGQTPGTGPGLGGKYGRGFPDFASYADFYNRNPSILRDVMEAVAPGPIAGLLGLAARAFGATPGIQSAPGEGFGAVNESGFGAGTAFAGSPELGGQYAGGSSPAGGQGGAGSQADPVGTDPTGGTAAFALGGVPPLHRASLVGERGPELFVPRAAAGAARGGGGTLVVHINNVIDARGAELGVEPRIRQAMRETELRTLSAVRRLANQGGGFARDVGRR